VDLNFCGWYLLLFGLGRESMRWVSFVSSSFSSSIYVLLTKRKYINNYLWVSLKMIY